TGEYIVVQGDEATVQVAPGEAPAAGGSAQRWKEILDGRPDVGRWELEAHSHPVPEGGTEGRPENRVPSGASGDMGVLHDESVASGQPRSSRIDFETATGPDHTDFGYDPTAERPYWIDYPDPVTGARTTQRFASIEAYHEFLETRFGVVSEPVPEHMT